MYQYEVYLLKGEIELNKIIKEGYALLYKGEIIASGTREEIKKVIKEIAEAKDINKILNEFIDISNLSKNDIFKQFIDDFLFGISKQFYPYLLSVYEEAALKFYTTKNGYKLFNQALRGEIEMLEEFAAQERIMNKALDKLPISSYNQPDKYLYRIENLTEAQISEYYQVGKTIKNKHFTSATYDLDAIAEAMRHRPYTILIHIYGKNGRLIEELSTLKKEKEILFKSKTKFYVQKISKTTNPDNLDPILTIKLIEK